ncbi:hypothetical protein D9Q98_008766 [Chlorella vulgaris]|uniref:Luc7-like protein 3 n=1 Tax=Chlorella vulgaris TaxID=3077 RepID=A0A9D4TIL0_CHLVU|nr:hypothetical protein D9Q98_008766 [Chlorella vulgaris]
MADEMRAMLDQLMGKDRNVPLDQRIEKQTRFSDPEVCKHALAGLCPFAPCGSVLCVLSCAPPPPFGSLRGLFANTKSHLGPCEFELHEDHLDFDGLKAAYDALSAAEKERYGYERSLLRLLARLVSDMDRKIEKAQERAKLESMPKPLTPQQQAEVDGLRDQAKALTERSEQLAEQGDVDASMAALAQAERMRDDAAKLVSRLQQPDRFMEVCDVCGVFIQSTDNEARRRDHLEGKQYLGWLAIREKHTELATKYGGGGSAAYPPVAPRVEAEEGEVLADEPPPRSKSREGGDRRRRSRSRSRDRRRHDERDSRRHDERDSRRYDDRRQDDRRRYDSRGGGGYTAMPPPSAYRGRGGRY